MKKWHQKRRRQYHNACTKSPKLQSHNKPMVFVGLAGVSLLLLSACRPNELVDEPSSAPEMFINADAYVQEGQQIEESLRNSYARLASQRSDVCPKLIEEVVGGHIIQRTEEVMLDDYCDYFLYPEAGQSISVSANNRQIEAFLVVPTLYNFANGDYPVDAYDKHVIRLAYNGATYKPENLIYDVTVNITQ